MKAKKVKITEQQIIDWLVELIWETFIMSKQENNKKKQDKYNNN